MTSAPGSMHGLPCDAAMLVPHVPPMLLVSRLVEKADENDDTTVSIVEAVVPDSGPFIINNRLMSEYCIEVMAQAIAAVDGFPLQEGRNPATGFLTGVDFFSLSELPLPGERIRITLQKTFSFGAAYIFSGSINGPSGLIAEGQLKIWKIEE